MIYQGSQSARQRDGDSRHWYRWEASLFYPTAHIGARDQRLPGTGVGGARFSDPFSRKGGPDLTAMKNGSGTRTAQTVVWGW